MKNNIKVVVIESPYDTYQDSKEVRDLMGRVWKMKLDGYKLHYPYGIMPVSEIDFFANHVILCEEIQGELFPFAGSRSISTTQCKKSRIEFPVIEHLFQSISKEAEPLLQATKNWINNKEKKNEIIGYNSSWTMCPRVLESDHLKTLARDLSMAMYYYYYTSYNIPNIITAAASRFKVDRIQKEMGFEYVKDEFNNKLISIMFFMTIIS